MHRLLLGLPVLLVPLFLFACAELEAPEPTDLETPPVVEEQQEAEQPLLEEEDLVTRNVTYTGILEEGGVTIYQEGSHRLMLSDGKMVLVEPAESMDIALGLYVGKLVRARGDVMPTVEAGGTIMAAKEVHWIRREVDEEGVEREVFRVLCGGGVGCQEGFVCELSEEGGVCVEGEESEESEDIEELEEEEDESEHPFVGADQEVVPTNGRSAKALELMVDEDYAEGRWTQEYCSSHVGFCIPVHKNWYFKSFGAMSSVLWHVEMGAQPVDVMGDGPLVVELKSGDVAAIGVSDGEVTEVGSRVIGYRAWSDNRHFEISGQSTLLEPVTFVTNELSATE